MMEILHSMVLVESYFSPNDLYLEFFSLLDEMGFVPMTMLDSFSPKLEFFHVSMRRLVC